MECQITWDNHITLSDRNGTKTGTVQILSDKFLPRELNHESCRIQSFCTQSFVVWVVYNSIPLSSASILLQLPPLQKNEKKPATPRRVHYAASIESAHEWNGMPRDSFFNRDSNDSSRFRATFDLKGWDSNVLGISFVIQLEDDSWLKLDDHSDFYIGGGSEQYPSFIEIPLVMPENILPSPNCMMSLFRHNMFWLRPSMGLSSLSECPDETQFVLMKRKNQREEDKDENFISLLMSVDTKLRTTATLFGVGTYAAVRIETGKWSPLRIQDVDATDVCYFTQCTNPYEAIASTILVASKNLGTFSSRISKLETERGRTCILEKKKGVLNSLGFCTWDAFGDAVTEQAVTRNLKLLDSTGCSVGYLIIDDGWQAGGTGGQNFVIQSNEDGPKKPTLKSFKTNNKFSSGLSDIHNQSSIPVFLWVAASGYWGGISGSECDVKTFLVEGAPSKGLYRNNIEDTSMWKTTYEVLVPTADNVNSFYHRYFKEMKSKQNISGVKIDGQGLLELFCNPPNFDSDNLRNMSRVALTKLYRQAITKQTEHFFSDVVINCMACNGESIFCSGVDGSVANICWRTSDDHAFPGLEENPGAVAWHILSNSMNTTLLGEIFPVPDWDMFRMDHNLAKIHAVARIVSGGPIYFSDVLPFSKEREGKIKALMNSMLTNDGNILRCDLPGRPTRDCLFADPRTYPGQLFKVFNKIGTHGVLALFNLTNGEEGKTLTGEFCPDDIDDICRMPIEKLRYISIIQHNSLRIFHHENSGEKKSIELPSMSAMLVTVAPILNISTSIQMAVLGQPKLMNLGGAVKSIVVYHGQNLCQRNKVTNDIVFVNLHDFGKTYLWLNEGAKKSIKSVHSTDGEYSLPYCFESIDFSEILVVHVPEKQPYGIKLSFS